MASVFTVSVTVPSPVKVMVSPLTGGLGVRDSVEKLPFVVAASQLLMFAAAMAVPIRTTAPTNPQHKASDRDGEREKQGHCVSALALTASGNGRDDSDERKHGKRSHILPVIITTTTAIHEQMHSIKAWWAEQAADFFVAQGSYTLALYRVSCTAHHFMWNET